MEHQLSLAAAAFAGALSHTLIFIHGEWHLQATRLLQFYLSCFGALFIFECSFFGRSLLGAAAKTLLVFSTYNVSLSTSIVLYRLFFHSLCRYQGPFFARISKLWHVAHCRGSKNHLLMERLHRQYGDFVRTGDRDLPFLRKSELIPDTGPSELTVFDPDVLRIINDGQNNPCSKPAWYDNLRPYTGLNTHRSKIVHKHRRRVWDHGFTTEGKDATE